MKRFSLMSLLVLAMLVGPRAWAESGPDGMPGEKEFRTVCQSCHLESVAPEQWAEQEAGLKATPMDVLSGLIRQQQGDDRDSFIGHVVSFVRDPSPAKSLVPPQVIAEHGVMPPISQYAPELTYDDLRDVAGWIYDHYSYSSLKSHLRKVLPKGGKGWPAPASEGGQ